MRCYLVHVQRCPLQHLSSLATTFTDYLQQQLNNCWFHIMAPDERAERWEQVVNHMSSLYQRHHSAHIRVRRAVSDFKTELMGPSQDSETCDLARQVEQTFVSPTPGKRGTFVNEPHVVSFWLKAGLIKLQALETVLQRSAIARHQDTAELIRTYVSDITLTIDCLTEKEA